MADKLDILMESLFHYLHDVTHVNGKNSTGSPTAPKWTSLSLSIAASEAFLELAFESESSEKDILQCR